MVVEHQTIKKLLDYLELTLIQGEEMKFSDEEFLSNPDINQLFDRRLELAIECCIDMANHIAAALSFPSRDTAAEVFFTLGEKGIIHKDLAQKFKKIVGLRNVLVHRYIDIDHKIILEGKKQDFKDIREFAKAFANFLEQNPNL
ncbi:MAG: DUF86 domain-containing protein [Candidatus Blackburnbacteria bacterium]|nr:DUF86 domain-containing protein [Candidatus Blackburnbacteria bacterium]